MHGFVSTAHRYRPLNRNSVRKREIWQHIPPDVREAVRVVSTVLPFRVNGYVTRELIDWDRIPHDPMFQLTFPQRDMLDPEDYALMKRLVDREAPADQIRTAANRIRLRLNPQPAGQLTDNVPTLNGERLPGLQHKYKETVLFFPGPGQTCHAYCTYCFRWAQFVSLPDVKFEAREATGLVDYLRAHRDVTDVIFTGGDPMIMRTHVLRQYVEPLLAADLEHVRNIRIGTKALSYWPHRFVTDDDADELLELFEDVVRADKHLAVMAHYSHPAEMRTNMATRAVRRIRDAGVQIRLQSPLVRHVNDDADVWAELWRGAVNLGMVPYYMFVERDTGPKQYFEVPLARAYRVFQAAYQQVSGLARTVRGPSMSAQPGKVRVLGTADIGDERVFVLDLLQARDPDLVRRPFFAKYDPEATWIDQLEPAFADRFPFE